MVMAHASYALGLLLALTGSAWAGPASRPAVIAFEDGGQATYHVLESGEPEALDTLVFVIGGSGCSDVGAGLLPRVTGAMDMPARYLALNKRHVQPGARGDGGAEQCGRPFNEDDVPSRWVADTTAFVRSVLAGDAARWKKVVIVGASEGGAVAASVARATPEATHLVVIGDGGWSMRDNLRVLLGAEEVARAWSEITRSPDSAESMWLGHSHRYWFDVMDREPLQDYLALDIPVLIAVGERDRSIPVGSAQHVLVAALKAGKRNIGLVMYPGADHQLWDGERSYLEEFLAQVGRGVQEGVR